MTGSGAVAATRISLFVGKGGVGKSTLATATAVREARSGARVLIVSTDQAHSTGDVLGTTVAPTGERTPTRILADLETGLTGTGGGFLDALALDTLALLERHWREIAATLSARFPESDLGDVAPEELSALPGIQEVLGLHEVGELAASGTWDHVVVDCASTADAMRMLTLPATFELYLERAWPRHRRLSLASEDDRATGVIALLERITAGTQRLGALLVDADRVAAHLVLTPERVVAAEAVRTMGSLALMGVAVNELIVNQVLLQDDSFEYSNLPDHPAFDWYTERIAEQQAVLTDIDTAVGDVKLVLVPHVAFTMPTEAQGIRGKLRNIRRMAVVTTCGASWLLSKFVGEPGRRTLLRGVRSICHPLCRTSYLALYKMDTVSAAARGAYLETVRARMRSLR